jgi:hypothetical protein
MKEALSSFETSVLTRATRRTIPEDTILLFHKLKSGKLLCDSVTRPLGEDFPSVTAATELKFLFVS